MSSGNRPVGAADQGPDSADRAAEYRAAGRLDKTVALSGYFRTGWPNQASGWGQGVSALMTAEMH